MQLLQCVHFVMLSTQTIYNILYLYFQISSNITPNLIHIPCLHWKSYWEHDLSTLWWVIWLIIKSIQCFFRGVWPSFNGSICCPHFLRILASNHSYIYHLFPIKWSPYSSQCNGTYSNKHFPLLVGITRYSNFITIGCPFWGPLFKKSFESCVTIVSSFINFFDGPPTLAWICHIFNRYSFKHHMNTSPILCGFSHNA